MVERGIYVTAGGRRWHSRPDCEALAQGQTEAAAAGSPTHPVRRVDSLGDRQPCGWCVTVTEVNPATVAEDVADLHTDTAWEAVFTDTVLAQLPELAGWEMKSQPSLTLSGRTYRPDFSLTSGPLRIAVEIDGENKGPNAPSHDDWTRRQTAFVSDGWEMLRFTNRQGHARRGVLPPHPGNDGRPAAGTKSPPTRRADSRGDPADHHAGTADTSGTRAPLSSRAAH